jgi:hemoglobin/transferrin/lactoferrin receptor protein
MKKIITAILYIFASYNAFSQTVKVVDQVTLQEIDMVKLEYSKDAITSTTTFSGSYKLLESAVNQDLTFSAPGYKTVVANYADLVRLKFTIALQQNPVNLTEVVISANRTQENKADIPQQIEIIKGQDIQFGNPLSSGDLLSQSGNVFVQSSQFGGSSPVLRGFEANRVLLMIDGVRMNNAIYRGGHLQNVITIDPNMIDRTEIIFGPGSSIYGSDALGGVMHFYTRKPTFSNNNKIYITADGFSRVATAASEWSSNATVNIGSKKLAFLGSVTYKTMGDVHMGANRIHDSFPDFGKRPFYVDRIGNVDSMIVNTNENIQKYSGYSQTDMMGKVRYMAGKNLYINANIQYSTSSDIPRYDRLTESSSGKAAWAQWYYGPQKRLLTSVSAEYSKSTKAFDKFMIIAALQDIQEDRIQRRYRNNNRDTRREHVKVYTLNADFQKLLGNANKSHHELRYGGEIQLNDVSSKATREDIVKGTVRENITTRYPGKMNQVNYMSAYISHRWELSKKIIISDGLRYNTSSLNSEFSDSNLAVLKLNNLPYGRTIDQSFQALTGNLGLVATPLKGLRTSILFSTGFRAPNLDDVGKFFESAPGGYMVVPNPDLKPEYSKNGELSISYTHNQLFKIEGSAYANQVSNIVGLANAKLNGADSIVYDSKTTVIKSNQNLDNALVTGANISLWANVNKHILFYSTLNFTKGTLTTTDKPLDHIPPTFGKTGVRYVAKKFRAELYSIYNGWKKIEDYRLGAEDNEVYATAKGMPSWYTFNLKAEYTFSKYFSVQAGVENILDQHYRAFASGFSAPGRNVFLTLRVRY